MNRTLVAIAVCCGLVVTSGCLGLVGLDDSDSSDDEPSVTVPENISDGEDVQQALEATSGDLESLEGEKVQVRPIGYTTEEVTTAYAADIGTGYAATMETNETIYRAGPGVDREIQISNSGTTWHYMPQLETAVELPYGPKRPREVRIRGWLEDADLAYHGTEEIAGHETHHVEVLEFESNDVTSAFEQADEVHVWLDDEYWYPVKHRHVLNQGTDDERVETVTHTELEFDVEIDSDRFAFEVPGHVTRQDQSALSYSSETSYQTFDDIGAAEEAVPFDVATPESVPAGYELDDVSVSDQMLTVSATVSYSHPDEPPFDVRTQVTRPDVPDDADSLGMTDRDAVVYESEYGDTRTIAWTCDRLWYTVTGERSGDELRSIVAETRCQ